MGILQDPFVLFSLTDGQNFIWGQILLKGSLEIRNCWRNQEKQHFFLRWLENKEMVNLFKTIFTKLTECSDKPQWNVSHDSRDSKIIYIYQLVWYSMENVAWLVFHMSHPTSLIVLTFKYIRNNCVKYLIIVNKRVLLAN